MKIVFFGTSNVALPVLEGLHREHEVVGVVTTPDGVVGRNKQLTESPVSVLANELKLKIFKPKNPKNDNIFRLELAALNADIFIVVSYGKILPIEIINMPKCKTLNIHFSALPKYRGASPMQAALQNGDAEIAVSIFVLDEQLDHGPIVAAKRFAIDPDDNFLSLSTKLAQHSAEFLLNILPDYQSGKLSPVAQNEAQASVTKIITRQDGKISWNKTAGEIYNQFRAFYPWPGIWTTWNGKKLKIVDCKSDPNNTNSIRMTRIEPPGTVTEGGSVVCGQNTLLQINFLQLEGKTETNIADFLRGNKNFIGSKLE